jgi:uncharacterized protein
MRDERFEWDDRKAQTNLRKDDVPFQMARLVFDDPAALDELDDELDEERFRRVGLANGLLLMVVYTMRGTRFRIISDRKANRHEQENYFGQDS